MALKSASRQNIIASKYQIFTWKFTVKFQNFSSVGGGVSAPPNCFPKFLFLFRAPPPKSCYATGAASWVFGWPLCKCALQFLEVTWWESGSHINIASTILSSELAKSRVLCAQQLSSDNWSRKHNNGAVPMPRVSKNLLLTNSLEKSGHVKFPVFRYKIGKLKLSALLEIIFKDYFTWIYGNYH